MWLFSEANGFVSAVVHRDDPTLLMVRARARDHLERWFPGVDIQDTPTADYHYRVTVPRETFATLLADQVRNMKAENFKSESGKHFGHTSPYLNALHDVWSVMCKYQADQPIVQPSEGKKEMMKPVISIIQSGMGTRVGFEHPVTEVFMDANSTPEGFLAIARAAVATATFGDFEIQIGMHEHKPYYRVHDQDVPKILEALKQAINDFDTRIEPESIKIPAIEAI